MKRRISAQAGFIPMLLSIIGVVALIIYLIYTRVAHAAH